MSPPELYVTNEGRVPDVSSGEPDCKGWIGLGGDASKVQSSCIFYKDKSDRNTTNPSISERNGRLKELDWACDIDWFDEDYPW